MGINSYITHRMFVAALSHEEDTTAKDAPQQHAEETARHVTAKNPWDVHVSALTKTKSAASGWAASASGGGL